MLKKKEWYAANVKFYFEISHEQFQITVSYKNFSAFRISSVLKMMTFVLKHSYLNYNHIFSI